MLLFTINFYTFLPIIILAALGLIAGLGLAIASMVMTVPADEKQEDILAELPGINCGACGFSGCSGYAAALALGEASNGLCSPGGKNAAEAIAGILGNGTSDVIYKTAIVRCLGTHDNTSDIMEYDGTKSCAAAMQHFGGVGSCAYGCMGLGDCLSVCRYNAISVCNGVAFIDPQKCTGCLMCVKTCPKHLISALTAKDMSIVRCMNIDKGGETRKVCKAGCIGCMKCVKVCKADAIKVENSLASIDPDKCIGCKECSVVCPSLCISDFFVKREEVNA